MKILQNRDHRADSQCLRRYLQTLVYVWFNLPSRVDVYRIVCTQAEAISALKLVYNICIERKTWPHDSTTLCALKLFFQFQLACNVLRKVILSRTLYSYAEHLLFTILFSIQAEFSWFSMRCRPRSEPLANPPGRGHASESAAGVSVTAAGAS